MNNTAHKLILDRGSCEKLHKKLRFADPVFITPGIIMIMIIIIRMIMVMIMIMIITMIMVMIMTMIME